MLVLHDNIVAGGDISGDLRGGEVILVIFSESSVTGETGDVDEDVSDENTGNGTNVGGDLGGEGILVVYSLNHR